MSCVDFKLVYLTYFVAFSQFPLALSHSVVLKDDKIHFNRMKSAFILIYKMQHVTSIIPV